MYSDVFCKVYNEFGWNYYPESFGRQLVQWMGQLGFAPKNALDLACGTGVLCRILQEHGIEARGMDYSSGMIDIARESDPKIPYDVADMTTYRPALSFDLVTCTGDAINHIPEPEAVAQIFANVYSYLNPGGYFIFDLLNEREISTSEPFEMDFSDRVRVWFQMTRPGDRQVALTIRVYEAGRLSFQEVIRETIHDPAAVCAMLEGAGFRVERCADRLLEQSNGGTTWFVVAKKENCDEITG